MLYQLSYASRRKQLNIPERKDNCKARTVNFSPLDSIASCLASHYLKHSLGGRRGLLIDCISSINRRGSFADLIAIAGDPLVPPSGIAELERVKFVMKGGEVVRNEE